MAKLLESVLNQILQAQATEQIKANLMRELKKDKTIVTATTQEGY